MSDLETIEYEDLSEQQKAVHALIEAGENVFIQGSAGSGKSTYIKYLQDTSIKSIALCSSTGVSALNIGGMTLHSFFRLPISDIIDEESLFKQNRRGLSKLLHGLELLVIDEVSMVRPDMLDAIDLLCKKLRHDKRPFGGIQIVLIGDVYQLPPVITKASEELFIKKYGTNDVYFFDSDAYKAGNFKMVEFSKTYRQQDEDLLENLNNIKNKTNLASAISYFNSCKFTQQAQFDFSIILTPYRKNAEIINQNKLNELTTKEKTYEAKLSGTFINAKESNYPVQKSLKLKENALVMFTKNNGTLWVNGSLGVISELNKRTIKVKLLSTGEVVTVMPETWEDKKYTTSTTLKMNEETYEMEKKDVIIEEVVGTFRQFPLQLGYAITIHKAQGKTLDLVSIDLGRGAFTHGQLYVALSRTRHKKDINVVSPIRIRDAIISDRIQKFMSDSVCDK